MIACLGVPCIRQRCADKVQIVKNPLAIANAFRKLAKVIKREKETFARPLSRRIANSCL